MHHLRARFAPSIIALIATGLCVLAASLLYETYLGGSAAQVDLPIVAEGLTIGACAYAVFRLTPSRLAALTALVTAAAMTWLGSAAPSSFAGPFAHSPIAWAVLLVAALRATFSAPTGRPS